MRTPITLCNRVLASVFLLAVLLATSLHAQSVAGLGAISGLVTDLGGPLAHGSIVAREYGIPAVMGVGNATQSIRDGDTITVDGTAGRVLLN